jgi:hypothetical protein
MSIGVIGLGRWQIADGRRQMMGITLGRPGGGVGGLLLRIIFLTDKLGMVPASVTTTDRGGRTAPPRLR